jgi:hypothetical protein
VIDDFSNYSDVTNMGPSFEEYDCGSFFEIAYITRVSQRRTSADLYEAREV